MKYETFCSVVTIVAMVITLGILGTLIYSFLKFIDIFGLLRIIF